MLRKEQYTIIRPHYLERDLYSIAYNIARAKTQINLCIFVRHSVGSQGSKVTLSLLRLCTFGCKRLLFQSKAVVVHITKTRLFKYIENFTSKHWKFSDKNSYIFHISAQNIDCGYSLEPPRRGGSNEYPQSMFWTEIRKLMYTPVNPSFTTLKWGLRGSKLYRHVFVMIICS